MVSYPEDYDSDQTIIRIDDNITELGGEAINQLRDAVFAMQGELGLGLSGSMGSLADLLAVSLNANGTIKTSALADIGLVTLPIVNSHVASNAGIAEYKLALDHSTSDLNTAINAYRTLLDSLTTFAQGTSTDFLIHLAGTATLSDGSTEARHVASQIDLNAIPSDPRDPFYTWTGLVDKNGNVRTATQVAAALLQVNDALVTHENATADAHVAAAISVDTDEFQEIPTTANTVQKVMDYLDDSEVLNLGQHRAVQHANGIPRTARVGSPVSGDGYGAAVVPPTLVNTYRAHPPANAPVDSNTFGDDVIEFKPDNTGYVFDSQFKNVQPGDTVRVNYGNGIETSFLVESKRFGYDTEWYIRINGTNLAESVDGVIDGYGDGYAYARIDRTSADSNTYGVLALAAANSIPSNLYPNIIGTVIVGHPRGASALGLEFDGNKINSTHYKLFLQMYPTGNPADAVIDLPFIDVTGDLGVTPGTYTLEKIVHQTNNAFRKVGYNYRFIAFDHDGNFGIMLADPIGNASFSIINQSDGTYANNVIGDDADGFDGLGLGSNKAGLASPAYQATFSDTTAAATPTYVISPATYRNYIVNGQRRDDFAPTYLANDDGYWDAAISAKVSTGSSVEVTYRIELDLCASGLAPGKTLVIQPAMELDDANYVVNDYGRFIIKNVNFIGACGDEAAYTTITVINGVHATGSAIAFTSGAGTAVRIYFSEDSVAFNDTNMIDPGSAGSDYHRLHEIYITDTGNTFSHERTRMVVQTESASLLGTANWHVKGVSPKLKGYRDSISTENSYLRFYVMSFDSTSGIYDGYVGQRSTVNGDIFKTGPLTSGRKNVPTRFYTESYVDYLDLEFTELSAGPGSNILSSAVPRYVDIEVFPTLRMNDEVMLLGSCEVNWDPASGQNIIQSVKSLRTFGSVDETEFTRSAMDFIGAGERALHDNGIVRGYEFVSVNGTTTGELLFTGGEAHVNGRIVASNATSVVIPQISEGGATPATVEWAVCVNMDGFLEPILLTTTADQFFAGAADYYVPSVTFAELVATRRDLTPIALVSATIASITINDDDVTDIRKFVDRIDSAQALVLSGGDLTGNFHTFESMAAWVKKHGVTGSKLKVRVRGSFDVATTVDLSEIGAALELEGDDATVNVTAEKGFLIDGNITFKNINFTYNPAGIAYSSGDYVNRTNGCIFGDDADTFRSNITVQDCKFSCTMSGTQRPPFIMIEMAAGDVLDSLSIVGNRFEDTTTIDQAAIAVVGIASSGTAPAISNSIIERNRCNSGQGCYLTSLATTSGTGSSTIRTFTAPGLRIAGVTVRDNTFGTIGYVSSGRANATVDGYYLEPLLSIDSNRAMYIGLADAVGKSWNIQVLLPTTYLVHSFGTGHVKITNNHCAWINAVSKDETANNIMSSILISGNSLSAFSDEYYEARYGCYYNVAITVNGLATEKGSVTITGNTINKRLIGSDLHSYEAGIWTYRSATITNNILRAFDGGATNSYGIIIGSASEDNILIQGNSLYRNGATLGSSGGYIISMTSNPTSFAMICDNYLDSMYVDDADTITSTIRCLNVATYPTNWRITRNKNHLKTAYVRANSGTIGVSPGNTVSSGVINVFGNEDSTVNDVNLQIKNDDEDTFAVTIINTSVTLTASWTFPLSGLLPEGATIVSVSVPVYGTDLSATNRAATLTLGDSVVVTPASETNATVVSAGVTLTLDSSDFTVGTYIVTPILAPYVKLDFLMNHSLTFAMSADQITIMYSE